MPILSDLREIKALERDRLETLRESHRTLEDIKSTAEDLARLGDRERPKAEEFIRKSTEAARATPVPREPRPPTIVGPDGRAISTNPGASIPNQDKRPAPPPISTSSGDAGGRGVIAAPQKISSVQERPGGGHFTEALDWVRDHCAPKTFRIPRPGNPRAILDDDIVEIHGWDCSGELHAEADFYDPDEWRALVGNAPRSSTGSGQTGTKGGTGGRPARPPLAHVFIPGEEPSFGPSGGSSTAPSPPLVPTPGDRLVTETLRTGFREVVRELRETGDLGLAIRRSGGL